MDPIYCNSKTCIFSPSLRPDMVDSAELERDVKIATIVKDLLRLECLALCLKST